MPVNPRFRKAVRKSRFIFRGTIMKFSAATMPNVPVDPHTAIVRVNRILQSPPRLDDFTGKRITVKLGPRQRLRVGQQRVFFTNGWIYGESIAVVAVDHMNPTSLGPNLQRRITQISQNLSDRQLQARINRADLVVSGQVVQVRPLTGPGAEGPISEHNPLWHEAVINVQSVEKGQLRRKRVSVQFPTNPDVLWSEAPKFQVAQEGVFLLHQAPIEGPITEAAAVKGRSIFTALHPLDFHPRAQMERVRNIMRRTRR